ncbi:hypothetical protein ACJX0J_012849, partial [Zea mays]
STYFFWKVEVSVIEVKLKLTKLIQETVGGQNMEDFQIHLYLKKKTVNINKNPLYKVHTTQRQHYMAIILIKHPITLC